MIYGILDLPFIFSPNGLETLDGCFFDGGVSRYCLKAGLNMSRIAHQQLRLKAFRPYSKIIRKISGFFPREL